MNLIAQSFIPQEETKEKTKDDYNKWYKKAKVMNDIKMKTKTNIHNEDTLTNDTRGIDHINQKDTKMVNRVVKLLL